MGTKTLIILATLAYTSLALPDIIKIGKFFNFD